MKGITEGRIMGDKIEKIGESLIQHGKFNDRIYLLKLKDKNVEILADQLDSLALKQGYKKIFAKISAEALPCFLIKGYIIEAFIPILPLVLFVTINVNVFGIGLPQLCSSNFKN